jgi:hypothetical protein
LPGITAHKWINPNSNKLKKLLPYAIAVFLRAYFTKIMELY